MNLKARLNRLDADVTWMKVEGPRELERKRKHALTMARLWEETARIQEAIARREIAAAVEASRVKPPPVVPPKPKPPREAPRVLDDGLGYGARLALVAGFSASVEYSVRNETEA